MNSKLLVGFVVLVLGAGVGWYVLQNNKIPTATQQANDQTQPSSTVPDSTVPTAADQAISPNGVMQGTEKGGVPSGEKASVSYTEDGFSPKSMTVQVGTTVTFVNNSSKGMWVASDVHPTHQLLPGFDQLKSVQKGGTYDYTFIKVGTWALHNHVSASDKGTVVVTK